jgi:hypothetical protein
VNQDPAVRDQAHGILSDLFSGIGRQAQGGSAGGIFGAGALATQLEQFAEMPLQLAQIFIDMSTQLTELVLKSLEEAGIVLAKGLMP